MFVTNTKSAIATLDILQNIKLTWVDNYEIAAGDQSFSAGTKIEATTDPRPIKFKQSVTLNTSFLLEAPVPAPQLEDGEFELKTKKTASAYLYKEYPGKAGEKGVMKPFYITKDGPNPPGTNVLAPKAVTRLYFAKHVETGTMIDDYQSDFIDIDLTKKTTATVQYNADGAWVQSNA